MPSARAQAERRFLGDPQRPVLSGALRLRVGNSFCSFRPLADGLLVVSPSDAPVLVPHDP